jgi:hypothetical protein
MVERKRTRFEKDIDLVARARLNGVNPISLEAESSSNNPDARVLSLSISVIDGNKLNLEVERRMEELRAQEMEEPKGPSPAPRKAIDIEAVIEAMHVVMNRKWGRNPILDREVSHERSTVRKNLGLTQANKSREIEENFKEAILRLEHLGWWEMMVVSNPTSEEREFFHRLMNRYREPYEDPYSSDGFTVYPDTLSFLLEVYGGRHLFRKRNKGNAQKTSSTG